MIRRAIIYLTCVLTLAIALWSWPVNAQPAACAERSKVIAKLEEKFGETLRSLGLHNTDGVVEVYASDETGSWTILISRPDGMSCMLASGQLWEQDASPLTPPGDEL